MLGGQFILTVPRALQRQKHGVHGVRQKNKALLPVALLHGN